MNIRFVGMTSFAAALAGFTVDVSTCINGESFLVAHNNSSFMIFKIEADKAVAVHSWTYFGPRCNNLSQCRDYAANNLATWHAETHKNLH